MEKSLLEQLQEYAAGRHYPFHMPGHKRNPACGPFPTALDITEIEGFDNLHHARSVLAQAQNRAAALYGADKSFFLVNGSTGGILAAVSAAVSRGGRVLLARNSHQAAYHALYLNQLKADYLYPELWEEWGICGGISPDQVDRKLTEHPDIEAVFITSPTYEGMVSNLEEIADITHRKGKILIVDEAHGAHFGFDGAFPKRALQQGADLVIESLHKTLPALTQSAILHLQGDRADAGRLQKFLRIYQTSSPSYVLMAGMDWCLRQLEEKAEELFGAFRQRLEAFYEAVKDMRCLHVIQPGEAAGRHKIMQMDPSKICCCVLVPGMTGADLYHILLDRYQLQMEMAAGGYVLAMTSIMDTEEGFQRLERALLEIDAQLQDSSKTGGRLAEKPPVPTAGALKAEPVLSIAEADLKGTEEVKLSDSEGWISKEYRYVYPPGIPVLVPGERVTREILKLLESYEEAGLSVQGQESRDGVLLCAAHADG